MRPIEATGFEVVPEGYKYEPKEVVEAKEMGNITKLVFANGNIEYHIFDSQVGSLRISHKEGSDAETAFDRQKRDLSLAALNHID